MDRTKSIAVIIADSQFLIVESLKSLLQMDDRFSLTAIVSTKSELLKVLHEINVGLLIIDAALIDNFELSDLEKIKHAYPDVFILVLTNSLTKPETLELIKSGIKNIIYKTAGKEELLTAIELTL